MDPTLSISKGVFVFNNSAAAGQGHSKTKKIVRKTSKKSQEHSIIGADISSQPYYQVYLKNWKILRGKIDELQSTLYENILKNIVEFISRSYVGNFKLGATRKVLVIPTAVILTGVNQTDHLAQFQALSTKIVNNVTSHVVLLQARDCPTVKAAVETIVLQFVEEQTPDDENLEESRTKKQYRKSQLTMSMLKAWYSEKYAGRSKQNLVVILPDFELFNARVLQDLILILSTYISELPVVLIFGVATSISTIYDVLPYNILRNIQLKIYQSESAILNLNKILETVMLTPACPFHLSGKVFQFLIDIFIFYDFSLNGIIQGFKYLMLEHYSQGNIYSLCAVYDESIEKAIHNLTAADVDQLRRLLSFRRYVESIDNSEEVIALLTQDDYVKRKLPSLLRDIHVYLFNMHLSLEILKVFVSDLPKNPLGKQIRELYFISLSNDITKMDDYIECIKLMMFHSKGEILMKLTKCFTIIDKYKSIFEEPNELYYKNMKTLNAIEERFKHFHNLLTKAGVECATMEGDTKGDNVVLLSDKMSRQQLMDKLLQAAKHRPQQPMSGYMKTMKDFIGYFESVIIQANLRPLNRAPPLYELFVCADTASARQHLLGTPRASIHTALNNPNYYLQCSCCDKGNTDPMNLLSTMPDLSVAYKLHLECGKMINLYDWLQAFNTVIGDGNANTHDDNFDSIDPKIQYPLKKKRLQNMRQIFIFRWSYREP